MTLTSAVRQRIRRLDTRVSRRSGLRRILVDARTPVNFTMVAPVYHRMRHDERARFYFMASEEPSRALEIFGVAGPEARIVGRARAAATKFDAYLAADFMWATLPRGAERIQMFHGVGGKYGFDAPTTSMRDWDHLFFVNSRRLRNFIAAGAIDAGSPAIHLVGMPKVDCLVDGSLRRDSALQNLGLDPSRPSVLYAPTWSPASSLNAIGVELVRRLFELPISVIVKLHDRSKDMRARYSGGIDWTAGVAQALDPNRGRLAVGPDICPYLAAADVLITDHSSAGFEYLLLDRPIVRIERPELIALANIHPDYVGLLADVSASVNTIDGVLRSVEDALERPGERSASRRAVAADLFYRPGTATTRCVEALYEIVELSPAGCAAHDHEEAACLQSA